MKKIKVVELFAGVGGFRLGLEGPPTKQSTAYEVVWSNQWEPSTKKQHASLVYQSRWPNCDHSNADIAEIVEQQFERIPNHDLLVGGFPCQDYSVATSLRNSKGLQGKKGVLWWSIEGILRKKGAMAPNYLMLENVDRLLKSPANQRGRDFAIMLRSLSDLGYAVEWRIINAAEYGMPQRRRRIFIMAYRKGSELYSQLINSNEEDYLLKSGLMAKAFPVKGEGALCSDAIAEDLVELSKNFNKAAGLSPFLTAGLMIEGKFYTQKVKPIYAGKRILLEDVLLPVDEVPSQYFIQEKSQKNWKWQKGAKKIERTSRSGHKYMFSEGGMTFPDALDRPSRTIVTGEGGPAASRFKHVVEQDGRLRRLCPIELERLNMFPDDHTMLPGISDSKRAFFMGNALVVGVVARLGEELAKQVR
jgi:DNA (cytosine-5)-methyltransferase 1